MTDKTISVMSLSAGLDLSTAKMLAEPGTMLDCLNYEVVDQLGYRRIDGFTTYDGNVSLKDAPFIKVYTAVVTTNAGHPVTTSNFLLREPVSLRPYAWAISYTSIDATSGTLVYIPLTGSPVLGPAWSMPGPVIYETGATITEGTITQQQLINFEAGLRALVDPLPGLAVGLHWHREFLFAAVSLVQVKYLVDGVNLSTSFTPYGTITADGTVSGVLLDRVVTTPAGVATAEEGLLTIRPSSAANVTAWEALNAGGSATLTGAITAGADVNLNQTDGDAVLTYGASDAASLWVAYRDSNFAEGDYAGTPGWTELSDSFTTSVTLSGVATAFNSLTLGNTEAESTYYFESSSGNSVSAVLLDYYVVSGSFTAGDAVVRLQITKPVLNAGTHDLIVTTADDMYLESGTTTKLGDISTSSSYNALPGVPSLKANSSRYEFLSSNFYADDDGDAVYGVNGAGRAFTFDRNGEYLSFIYTQADDTLDKPRHIENHALHLALGFKQGSVQLSVVGQPTNFSGALGASEIGVGDRLTGLMALPGATLGVFCESSIWSIVGTTVDSFDTQVISPKTGCIEYSLVNCGEPVFCNNYGVATLQTSASYGDFVGSLLSSKVSSWLTPRLRRGVMGTMNAGGIACAIPVREKNQYRLFFNDGNIMTMTLRNEGGAAFTFQKYYLSSTGDVYDVESELIPLAYTSQVDQQGKERIFVSHYNELSSVETPNVYSLDTGNSFNGTYIPHYFTTNWYFGDTPQQYSTLAGVRLHGQSRGLALLKVQAAGAQNDFYFSGSTLSTATVPINIPRTTAGIVNDFQPVTNRADIAARGLAIQLKFSGSNTDLDLIEPSHLAQVLILASLPDGAADI